MNEAPSNRALVGDALDVLFRVLGPYVEARMRAAYGEQWLKEARGALHNKPPSRWDVSDFFTLIYFKYAQAFRAMGHEGRSWVSLLKETRKRWAHQGELSVGETRRAVETTLLVLRAVGADAEARRLEPFVLDLMQRELGERQASTGSPDGSPDGSPGGPAQQTGAAGEADDAAASEGRSRGLLGRGLKKLHRMASRSAPEPLELRHQVLDEIERIAAPHGDGFPFSRIVVHALAPDAPARLLFEAALEGQPEPLRQAVLRRLAEARLSTPPHLHVSWKLHRKAPPQLAGCFDDRAFHVEVDREAADASAMLVVVQGKAGRERYTVRSGAATTIGRLAEVADAHGRLVRRNRVAFVDYDDPDLDERLRGVHRTVSRAHARITFDPATGAFRLHDDQSTWGTSVVREGYPVPIQVRQQPVALRDGDLLYFGQACIRFLLPRDDD